MIRTKAKKQSPSFKYLSPVPKELRMEVLKKAIDMMSVTFKQKPSNFREGVLAGFQWTTRFIESGVPSTDIVWMAMTQVVYVDRHD